MNATNPTPQIDVEHLSTAATRAHASQREQLQTAIDQLAKDAREAAAVMNKNDLRRLLEKTVEKPVARTAVKDDMVELYAKARVDASNAKQMLDGLDRAARADRRAAEKLNEMAKADAALAEAIMAEIEKYGLIPCMRSVRLMDLPGENHAAIHARKTIEAIQGGKEFREALLEQFALAYDVVVRYPQTIRFSGTGPSATRLNEHGDASGSSDFIRALSSAYFSDLTMAIPLAYLR